MRNDIRGDSFCTVTLWNSKYYCEEVLNALYSNQTADIYELQLKAVRTEK